ncbi:helix-turn-helix domain-containing protein [Methylophilus sp. Leaf414]|uniref:AlbA family DNA-binding domain-containing protein n=1 Tax=Methylophilus sp. Leaf414 TaxID=1736371 RepID=UPI0007014D97|nr:ATP-binding protein [Methylophilus sp. Leaf414]KQT37708.1 hypothetical protein ASG24_01545 [Methylophilus sp. Leaf414]
MKNKLLQLKIDEEKLLVKNHEGEHREFKLLFEKGSIWKYAKTLVSFANKGGGVIFFGIRDKPHTIEGFNGPEPESKIISDTLRQYFEPEINISLDTVEFAGKKIMYVAVEESLNKPIICRKRLIQKMETGPDKELLREGAIYYRYDSSCEEIRYSELRTILDQRIQSYFKSLVENITVMNEVGINQAAIVNAHDFSGSGKSSSIYVSTETAKRINWIRKGKFTEDQGNSEKAYYVTREVILSRGVEVEKAVDPGEKYTMTKTAVCKAVSISANYIDPILHKLNLNTKEHHHHSWHGKNPNHKYTPDTVDIILSNYPLGDESRTKKISDLNAEYRLQKLKEASK